VNTASNGSTIPEQRGGVFSGGLSVFFPAFNDARALPKLLSRTFEVLRTCVRDFEVIVVNDGSTDDTAAVLSDLCREYHPFLRVVHHPRNLGYGAALNSGLAAATKEFLFYTDGDGQYDPTELAKLLEEMTDDVGLVNCYKTARQDPWHRKVIGQLYNWFARLLFRIELRDIDCDFRLIRRRALGQDPLRSTSGTICVELVSRLERSGMRTVEVPVRHYAREHGRSRFFRIRSLLTTLFQLCALCWRSVLTPFSRGQWAEPVEPLSRKRGLLFGIAIVLLSVLAYARALQLPFISDDYVQISLAREYGTWSGWAALARDALYRCRATSLILTYWTEQGFGLDPVAFSLSSLAIHVLNSFLVLALGFWKPIGWRVSAVGACFFAVSQRHHEAVIWYAAIPELLVFFFLVLSFVLFVRWLDSERGEAFYWGAFGSYLAALLSKESAVVLTPLLLFAAWIRSPRKRGSFGRILPFGICGLIYAMLVFAARQTHLHFNDAGTFSMQAPFAMVLMRSAGSLFRDWGALSLIVLVLWKARHRTALATVAGIWLVLTFLPYCFLTYMPTVPSRHTYLASVSLSFIVAAAILELYDRTAVRYGLRLVGGVCVAIVLHQSLYLWLRKQEQFEIRAQPTERLVELAGDGTQSPLYIKCFPLHASIAHEALRLRFKAGTARPIVFGEAAPNGVDLCLDSGERRPPQIASK
jgi:hypothetical protein